MAPDGVMKSAVDDQVRRRQNEMCVRTLKAVARTQVHMVAWPAGISPGGIVT